MRRYRRTGLDFNRRKKDVNFPLLKEIFSWIIEIAIVLMMAFVLVYFIGMRTSVVGQSMSETLENGDQILVNRFMYKVIGPKANDVIVFLPNGNEKSHYYVKRVIGLPGDTIDIEDGKIYINGSAEPLQEDYLKEEWTVATGPYTFEVPEGSYFMMGDNRNDSWDARYWSNTYVTKDKILGKALFTYWPFAHFGKLE